jgi:hypothetical protein
MDNNNQVKTLKDLENDNTDASKNFSDNQKTSDIQLDALHIDKTPIVTVSEKVDFSGHEQIKISEDKQLHYWRWFLRLVNITWVSIIGALLTFLLYQYTYQSLFPVPSSDYRQIIVDTIHTSSKNILTSLGLWKKYRQWSQLSITDSRGQEQLISMIDAPINIVDKKRILQASLQQLVQLYNQEQDTLSSTQRDLAQYGFLPQELVSIFQDSDVQVSLQRGLVALESIKFSTAIQVFWLLETFITEFAVYGWWDTNYVREQMNYISARWDEDIYAFLSHCYMNPYELSYDCSVIGDFDVRYSRQIDTKVDPSFLKQLLYYIDQKLEQIEMPSFNIVFQRFDPRTETITFSIEVNTLQQDEAALIQAGIINPHIYIVTNLIHLLKQNRFIQWSAIDAKQIQIQPKAIRIWSNQFIVNNSILQYTLPLQKDVAREIYDFESR